MTATRFRLPHLTQSHTVPLWITAVIGWVPALIMIATMRLDEGRLTLLTVDMGPYSMNRLLGGLIAVANPLLLLAPIAWFVSAPGRFRTARILPLLFPLALFGPTLIGGVWIGGTFSTRQLVVLTFLAVALPAFTLWLEHLAALFGKTTALLGYGILWGFSSFLNYLDQYVLAYLEGRLDWAHHLIWFVPPIGGLADLCGGYLIEAPFDLRYLAIILVQSAILGTCTLWRARAAAKTETA
ncbi:hypothetical protein [Acanthopleuribacter pedis]|uniref:Uncharacterized protein n=1 Tax=Acanthopleuribacter pedis TaxID=442870 RepID=A0A8J7QF15_9BACT|nr:hypothetical protein [Acanthopleuribacter pedis]MBO1317185.1 hypothetical protein [Acanthopleuribacter pedis]